jgi:hypothetical protein
MDEEATGSNPSARGFIREGIREIGRQLARPRVRREVRRIAPVAWRPGEEV